MKILRFKKVGSTMDIARRLAEKNGNSGTAIVAEAQSNGRGQFKRNWISPKGGLYMSVLFKPAKTPGKLVKLNIILSFLAAGAINKLYRLPVKVKPPNDILVNGKKIAGVLIETSFCGKKLNWVIAGIGINVNTRKSQLAKVGVPSTSIRLELGRKVSMKNLLKTILSSINNICL